MKDFTQFTADRFTDALYEKLLVRLAEESDAKYRAFHAGLLPPGVKIMGVRMPVLKAIAQAIARGDWRGYLALSRNAWYEESMLQGFAIGCAKAEKEEIAGYLAQFFPRIDNWAVCDSTAANLKIVAKNPEYFYPLAVKWAESGEEYTARFGLVLLLDYYVARDRLPEIFSLAERLPNKQFYAQVALAWLLSVCFVKFPVETGRYLETCGLEEDTFRRTARKILESNRVGMEDKHYIRGLKRK